MTKKTTVAVLYGGVSGEHEVSIISASSVIKHIDRKKYSIIPIGIDKKGRWHRNELANVDPLEGEKLVVQGKGAKPFSLDYFFHTPHEIEVVFPVLHGTNGEDGTMQGFLELANVAYVGAGVLSSSLGMDKDVTKRLALQAGIKVTPYWAFTVGEWQRHADAILEKIEQKLTYPMFAKPANTGSSVGITKVKKPAELRAAIDNAFLYDSKAIVEQGLRVREVELAVLENPLHGEKPLVSVPGEIITSHEFYTYEAKYLDEKSLQLIIPAQVSDSHLKELQRIASTVFELLECRGMARVDCFIDKDTDAVVFNEINTIPGFTHVSMYPMMWQKSGKAYPELLDNLLQLAIARQDRKLKLKRSP